ncbi:hypothetical protein OWR29_23985 [Actinoplanes sp. Pm04-4]|uniref:DUF6817 domain-containing protein n=1 Tax=Paractinoplanes pyxinae TaxID=2997416 RepID=A0ABT4B5B2_9ACTN|nr:hypothetical protein [Actinoplanes pyxinae]MCY1141070.1 hypothetical protein [Actinoplanes pyxinae]
MELLRSRGAAEVAHPGGTLLVHLIRVSEQLAAWGAPADVQAAGLCHAAYGTDGFRSSLLSLDERPTLAEVIGGDAEELVYLYGSCDRAATYPQLSTAARPVFRDRFTGLERTPGDDQVDAFVEITAANELDVFAHDPQLAARYGPELHELLAASRERLSAAAWAAVQHDLGG